MSRRAAFLRVVALASAVVLVAACGGDDDDAAAADDATEADASPAVDVPADASVSEIFAAIDAADLSTDEREAFLYERAKEEGSVILYSPVGAEHLDVWTAAFNDAYPGVTSEYVRLSTTDMLERLEAEAAAGQSTADVAMPNVIEIPSLLDGDLFADLHGVPVPEDYPSEAVGARAVMWYATPRIMMWNTENVTDPPAELDDLLEPAHAGCVMTSSYEIFTGALIVERGVEGAEAWYQAFLANDGIIGDSQSSVSADVAAGAVDCALNPLVSSAEELMAEGAPVDWAAPDPSPASASTLTISSDADHPYAAALLMLWLLGPDGSTIAGVDGRLPLHPDVPPPTGRVAGFIEEGDELNDRLLLLSFEDAVAVAGDVERLVATYVTPNLVADDD
jgi:iron(III) transport system substrate-binding protein